MTDFDKYQTKGAYHFDWYEKGEPAWYKTAVDRCVGFCSGSTLDVGCGDGLVVNKLTEGGYTANGVDSDFTGIQLARYKTKNARFACLDINKDKIEGVWEYMVCLNVIEHLEHPESVFRIFRDNITRATIIITDTPQEHPSPYHVKEFSPKELADLFYPYEVRPFQIDKDFHGIEVYK